MEYQSGPESQSLHVRGLVLSHLRALEAESIHILREVMAEFERPVMLYSVGRRVHAVPAAAGVAEIARELNGAGVIALVHGAGGANLRERTREAVGAENFIADAPEEAAAARRMLEERGLFPGFSQPE